MDMPIPPGTYRLDPKNAKLRIETRRGGAAAKAGHDLEIEIASWEGSLSVDQDGQEISLELNADTGSMQVTKGTGGVMSLTEEDKLEVVKTLESEVLQPGRAEFESTQIRAADDGRRLEVSGELKMNGARHPLQFELDVTPDGQVSGEATLRQSDWDIKPYSGLFGTLRVKDEVRVIAEATLPEPQA
jgi:polyisoprenoid-binding protein YceI